MKRILIGIAIGTAVASLAGCATGSKNTELTTDTLQWSDSVLVDTSKAVCDIKIEWPVEGTPAVVDSIRAWIVYQIGRNGYVDGTPDNPSYATAASNLNDGSALVAAVGANVLSRAKIELESIQYRFPMTYEYSWNIASAFRTDKIVTYGAATYAYTGGAHGAASYEGQTFDLATGQRIGWDMFGTDKTAELRDMIRRDLMDQYFKVNDVEALNEQLLINADTLPLPTAQPILEKGGIVVTYQQYEIAPYSEGMPSCVLPYDAVKPLLTPDAQALIPTSAEN